MTSLHPELSSPEFLVFEWLTRRKIPFMAQQNMLGGVSEAGGAKIDFWLTELNIIIRVQSYFHTLKEAVARDILQKIELLNLGYTVVDVWEEAIIENIDRVMTMAVKGQEVD